MSLVLTWVTEHAAMVAADTKVMLGGKLLHTTKLLALPHLGMVLAGRGVVELSLAAFLELRQGTCDDFDGALRMLDTLLPKLHADMVRHSTFHKVDPAALLDGQEIYVVGHSALRGRMHRAVYVKAPGPGGAFQRRDGDGGTFAPWQLPHEPPDPSSAAAMVAIANETTRDQLARDPKACIGGQLTVAEMTREAITITTHAIDP